MLADEIERRARAARKHRLFENGPNVVLGRPQIERLLEHRDPFLFVDRVTHVDLDAGTIVGTRRLDPADPVFVGHFPSTPIYPGVLQIESLGQLGLCLFALAARGRIEVRPDDVPPAVRGLKIHHAAFLAPVRPGDELVMLARTLSVDAYTGTAIGQLFVGDSICCAAIMEVYFVDA